MDVSNIVALDWLRRELQSPQSKVVLLETAWIAKGEAYQNYLKGHIPGAIFFDMWQGVHPTFLTPRNLADVKEFQAYCQSLGLNSDSHIVIYDQGQTYFAARLWFMFKAFGHEKVSVLDGGRVYWQQNGHDLVSEEPGSPKKLGSIELQENTSNHFKNFNDVIKDACSWQVLDVRDPLYFQGDKHDLPLELRKALTFAGLDWLDPDKLHKGHIPNAVNIHYPRFSDPETRCFITPAELQSMYEEVGIDINKPILSTCYLGITACLVPLTAGLIQKEQTPMSVYLGSWTEYSQKASKHQIDTGRANKLQSR